MSAKQRGREIPTRLEAVRRRFEKWRRIRKAGARIPEPLWNAAVTMAGEFGLHRTAKSLSVNYYALKKRIEREAGANVPDKGPATFVELTSPLGAGFCECVLELDDADGARMRGHLKGGDAPDLVALSRSFWQIES